MKNYNPSLKMSEVEYIKKTVRNENEILNLGLLLNFSADTVPSIKTVANNFYLIEKCIPIEEKDFCPDSFSNISKFLSEKLYSHTQKGFSKGIYKYFYNQNNNAEKHYIPYLLKELEESIQHLNLDKDKIITKLLDDCKKRARPFLKWNPKGGFNLLHGDLHIGNIVKKNGNYFLIDYEYVRYGTKELEIANFIISCLIFYCQNQDDVTNKVAEYFKVIKQLRPFNQEIIPLSFSISILLYCITAVVKENKKGVDFISDVFEVAMRYE